MNSSTSLKIAVAAFYGILSTSALGASSAAVQGGRLYGDAGRGIKIFGTWCAACHAAAPHATDQAPTLNQLVADTARSDGAIRAFLDHPHSPMPLLELGNQQIEDIIVYLHAVKAGGAAPPKRSSP